MQRKIDIEPMRWNRLFWAFALSFMPIVLLLLGGLETLQTASIVGGAPLLIVALLLCIAMVKVARFDLRHQAHVDAGTIHPAREKRRDQPGRQPADHQDRERSHDVRPPAQQGLLEARDPLLDVRHIRHPAILSAQLAHQPPSLTRPSVKSWHRPSPFPVAA